MVRNDPKPTRPKEKSQEKEEQPQQQVIEVPINLELINNKLNYIISILDSFKKVK